MAQAENISCPGPWHPACHPLTSSGNSAFKTQLQVNFSSPCQPTSTTPASPHPRRPEQPPRLPSCLLFCMPLISSPHRSDLKKKKITSHHFSAQNPAISPAEPRVLCGRPSPGPCPALFLLPFGSPSPIPCRSLSFLHWNAFSPGLPTSCLCLREKGLP